MLRPSRSLRSINNVIASPTRALRIPYNLKLYGNTITTLHSLQHHPIQRRPLSSTQPHPVSVFLPHEDLQLKAANASKSLPSTSILTDHHDLSSYLRFHQSRINAQSDPAKRDKLSISSVYLGTRYEYLIQRHLQDELGFSLTRIGGKGDGGVDLIGTWGLPGLSSNSSIGSSGHRGGGCSEGVGTTQTFRVLLQAKRLSSHRKPMPSLMRELEGTLMGSSSSRPLQEAFAAHRIRVASLQPRTPSPSSPPSPSPSLWSSAASASGLNGAFTTSPILDPEGSPIRVFDNEKTTTTTSSSANSPSETQIDPIQSPDTSTSPSPSTLTLTSTPDLPTLGILITTRPLTDGVEKSMASSRQPLMYICLEESGSNSTASISSSPESEVEAPPTSTHDDGNGNGNDNANDDAYTSTPIEPNPKSVPKTLIRQITWNAAAARAGLEGYDVVTKYSDADNDEGGLTGEATFMYQGRPVRFPRGPT
ncbi:hypothetical protein OHC33_002997 [Knufia fluminis]|uniref:Uncharacterized protein n=1 Tax=Knufia fluminis TaxID=191047 RepID=A0AAN8IB39_9EURO|nr:hypothetical protein OHC33_002997 [Knufia fluminis]